MGRPANKKPFVNSLRIALKEAHEAGGDRLRAVAEALVLKAMNGDVQAIKEIADRMDGKVAQAIVGDDEHDPVRAVTKVVHEIVDPKDPGGKSV